MRSARFWSKTLVPAVALLAACMASAAASPPAAAPLPGSEDCAMCHEGSGHAARRNAGEPPTYDAAALRSSPHAQLRCAQCHTQLAAAKFPHADKLAPVDCTRCHAGAGQEVALSVHRGGPVRAGPSAVACKGCHGNHNVAPLAPLERQRRAQLTTARCAECHAGIAATYRGSVHGQLAASGSEDAPGCTDCHGAHGIRGHLESASPTYALNIPNLCGRCHRSGQRAAVRYRGRQTHILENYAESIHGKGLLESGLVVTATCVDCHTTHGEKPRTDPTSSVNPANVAATCSKCHRGLYDVFAKSIHSPTVSHSGKPLPTCSDCHSAHTISRTDTENFRMGILTTCGKCHQALAESYFESYHGQVSRLGYLKTAKCYDCHGAHDIQPASNAASHLSKARIVATCSRCHPGANASFAGYLPHATHRDRERYPALFFTFWGMTGLLVGTFAVAGLHTLLWLPRSLRYRRDLKLAPEDEKSPHYQRFPDLYRRLHVMVIVSFLGLALTGMTLKFSHTGWAWGLSRAFGGFESAGFIHRVCALITFSYFALHLTDLVRRQRASGLSMFKFITGSSGMLPGPVDLREFLQSLRWFLGRGPRPRYGRWTYWEKFDYFAVFWGVALIGATGLLLWFPLAFTRVLPGWVLNVATIIHSDEALLAAGFIFTVHFFNTHFRPEKFPMDTVIFTGSVPLEEFKVDRPREYAERVKRGDLDRHLVPAPDPRSVRRWKLFGAIALGTGTMLIVLIIWTALFR